jgi:ribosome-interacting GTPase 1
MAANLSPDYQAAEKRYKSASTAKDKYEALQEMLRTIPKHKGTEKMQADIKRRMSQTRKDMQKTGGGAARTTGITVKKSGEGQVVLIGPPNSGKSTIVDMVTAAEPEVADYPFTTRMPTPGMLDYEDIQIQLVDIPPLADTYIESWLPQIIRIADAALLVMSAKSDDILSQYEEVNNILAEHKIMLCGKELPPEEEVPRGFVALPTIMLANKMDVEDAPDNLAIFKEFFTPPFDIVEYVARDESNKEFLGKLLFDFLDLVRVYAKEPGKKPSKDRPFVFKRGDCLYDMAYFIHSDFADNLKQAKVWGAGKFDGQLINKDYILEDRDVIEIHM